MLSIKQKKSDGLVAFHWNSQYLGNSLNLLFLGGGELRFTIQLYILTSKMCFFFIQLICQTFLLKECIHREQNPNE